MTVPVKIKPRRRRNHNVLALLCGGILGLMTAFPCLFYIGGEPRRAEMEVRNVAASIAAADGLTFSQTVCKEQAAEIHASVEDFERTSLTLFGLISIPTSAIADAIAGVVNLDTSTLNYDLVRYDFRSAEFHVWGQATAFGIDTPLEIDRTVLMKRERTGWKFCGSK